MKSLLTPPILSIWIKYCFLWTSLEPEFLYSEINEYSCPTQGLCTQIPWVLFFLPYALVLRPCAVYLTFLASFIHLYQSGFNQRSRTCTRSILRDLLNKIGLCDCEAWLPQSKICKQSSQESNLDSGKPAKAIVQSQNFFFIRKASVLLLRSFNWLNQVHSDYLG